MPKSNFKAVNRQFGVFMTTVLKEQNLTLTELRKHCHFDHNALSFMREV